MIATLLISNKLLANKTHILRNKKESISNNKKNGMKMKLRGLLRGYKLLIYIKKINNNKLKTNKRSPIGKKALLDNKLKIKFNSKRYKYKYK